MTHLGPNGWTVLLLVATLGGFATGSGGFGFALVTTPVLLWILPQPVVVLSNLAASIALRMPMLWSDRQHIVRKQAVLLAAGGLIGMPLGIAMVRFLDSRALSIAAQVVLVALGLVYLVGVQRMPRLPDPGGLGRIVVGIGTGALNTSISVSGPPLVLWLLNQKLSGRPFRATISAAGLGLNLVGVALLTGSGSTPPGGLLVAVAILPAAGLGTILGNLVLRRIPEGVFVRIAAVFVVVTSLVGLVLAL